MAGSPILAGMRIRAKSDGSRATLFGSQASHSPKTATPHGCGVHNAVFAEVAKGEDKETTMGIHVSAQSIERLLMGRLGAVEFADREKHLLQCYQRLHAIRSKDLALPGTTRRTAWKVRRNGLRKSPFQGAYHVVQADLPHASVQNIGILLRAENDRLLALWRRDFDEFAGVHTHLLKQLSSDFPDKARELGTQKCLEWLKAASSRVVRVCRRRRILIEYAAVSTLNALYARNIRPCVLPFRTHLPQYSLEAAADKFGRQMAVEPEGWVEVRTDIPLNGEMFAAHVEGHSMEPLIPDASLCVFQHCITDPWDGKVQLVEQYGESGGSRHTVKLCHLSTNVDPTQRGDKGWRHQRVTLDSINPNYESWDVAANGKIRALGEFLFVVGPAVKLKGNPAPVHPDSVPVRPGSSENGC
jgi:hypothetical protein